MTLEYTDDTSDVDVTSFVNYLWNPKSDNANTVSGLDEESLIRKYNRHIYTSKSTESTKFKIGPHIYGGEVQDIKILESKAVIAVQGARTSTDFLTDDGTGYADIQVTMLFSGTEHIKKGLLPLIALFRVSPITSVQNNVINDALYNKFTENNAKSPDKALIEKSIRVANESIIAQANQEIREVIGGVGPIGPEDFNLAKSYGADIKESTYDEWQANLARKLAIQTSDVANLDSRLATEATLADGIKNYDNTGHVPVAFVGIQASSHPDFINSVIVVLTLKRISVSNYLRNSLQYRSIKNTATPDARRAFWLNRAITMYMDRYYRDFFVTPDVTLSFKGDDLQLKYFVAYEKLVDLNLNPKNDIFKDDRTGTSVTQLSYSIRNKFSFKRLQGESYPTAQHMGVSSGNATISLRTNDLEMFRDINTYKSAADFFVRASDRSTRFNGWKLRSIVTDLFNDQEYNLSIDQKISNSGKLFYPLSFVTSTVSEIPNGRDVTINFAETSPNFFTDYGFVILSNGLTVTIAHDFFASLFENSKNKDDFYSQFVFYGEGADDEQFSILNPDTMIAALLEPDVYSKGGRADSTGTFVEDPLGVATRFLKAILEDKVISGKVQSANIGIGPTLDQLGSVGLDILKELVSLGVADSETFNGMTLDDETAGALMNSMLVFSSNVTEEQKKQIFGLFKKITNKFSRGDLYVILHNKLINGDVTLKNLYAEHLFATIVNKRKVPVTDYLYSRLSVANAFDALERAIEIKGDIINKDANSALDKSRSNDDTLTYGPDGTLTTTKKRATCYPDFIYITYEELFDLVEPNFPDDYWKLFAYTYHDYGIINPNIADYSNDPTESLKDNNVQRAQLELITKANSPVSPAVFFYRERELEDLRNNLSKEYSEWFAQLDSVTINIPYDVEYLVTEAGRLNGELKSRVTELNSSGQYEVTEKTVESIKKIDQLTLASIIERMPSYIRNNTVFNNEVVRKAGEDLSIAAFRQAKKTYSNGIYNEMSDTELVQILKRNGSEKTKFLSYAYGLDTLSFNTPIFQTTHLGKEVATYKRNHGLQGGAVFRTAINLSAQISGKTWDQVMTDAITKAAAGLDDGVTISNSVYGESQNTMLKITQSLSDLRHDMIRAFPVFKLYLIEYNSGDRIFVRDNFYGYNAIESIDIMSDKNDADLATIRIADPLQLLQASSFSDKISWNKGQVNGLVLPNSGDDLTSNNFLSRLELKQGRKIQIRAGYSADAENLDIVFTGRVAEVIYGDVVTVVAQGWKAELLGKQVSFELRSIENSSVKDLVVRTIRDANPAGMGQVLSQEETNELLKVSANVALDGALTKSIQNQYGTLGGESGYAGGEGLTLAGTWNFLGNRKAGVDLRLKNIWVPDVNKSRFNPIADVDTTGWEARSWVIPLQPAWDLLANTTNYTWDYICQVVPYDGEATLFYGKPDQLYYFTKGSPKRNYEYRKVLAKEEKEVVEDFQRVFDGFVSSYYFGNNSMDLILGDPNIVTVSKDQDFITQPLIVKNKKAGNLVTIDPEGFSYLGYKLLVHPNVNTSSYASITEGVGGAVAIKANYARSFKDDMDYISNVLGNKDKAAYLMIASFYGFSTDYLSKNFSPLMDTIDTITGPLPNQELNKFRISLIESITPLDNVDRGNEIFTRANIDSTAAKSLLDNLNDGLVADMVFNTYEPVTTLTSVGFTQKSSFIDDVSEFFEGLTFQGGLNFEQRNKADRFIAALTEAVAAYPSILAQLGKTQEEIVAKLKTRDGFNFLLNQAKFNLGSISKSISSVGDAVNIQTVFDPIFQAMANRLHLDIHNISFFLKDDIVNYIIDSLVYFRAYVHFFREYIQASAIDINVKDRISDIKNSGFGQFPPALNMKPFRDYHYISSGVDIIKNNIGASVREMSNTILVRYPASITTDNDTWYKVGLFQGDYDESVVEDVEWTIFPTKQETDHMGFQFNEHISLENKKMYVHTDLNVRRRDQAAKVATNIMAKQIRPMYRNNILLTGRAIKPWDVIYLDDKYIDMNGPIEVENVVHHYSVSAGWVTNIIPHALCHANPGNSMMQVAVFNNRMDKIYSIIDYTLWGLVVMTAIPTLGASFSLAGAAAGKAGQFALERSILPFVSKGVQTKIGEKLAQKLATEQLTTAKLRTLGQILATNGFTTFKAFQYTQTADIAAGAFTRYFYMNAGVADLTTPVLISPLMFKGVPFEAGLNGQENSYWSLTSKIQWGYQDLITGIDNWTNYIAGIFGDKSPIAQQTALRSLGIDKK